MAALLDHLPEITRNPEVVELLATMAGSPRLFHEIMLYFQKFKTDQPQRLEPAAPVPQADKPSPEEN